MNNNGAEGFRLIAHRGASALAPENTRAAFRRARDLGVTEVETDVRLTRDRQVVLFHDPTLRGKLGVDSAVETMTLAELEAMNISSWFFRDGHKALNDPDAGWDEGEPQRGSGGCVMGLDSYLDEFGFDFHHHIEIKGKTRELPNATFKAIDTRGLLDCCTFTSFNLKQLERLRAIDEQIRTGWLFPSNGDPIPDPTQSIKQCMALGLQECNPRLDLLTVEYVRRIHAAGLVVRTFGIRSPDDLWRAIETGADGATVNWIRSATRILSKVLRSGEQEFQMAAVDGQNETFRYKRLLELAGLFFRLGTVAFGGPAAHISMFREEVVRRRQWIDDRRFLDLLGATSLIPGPNSTEMAIHIGFERARWAGLVVAGVCFILPAFVFVTGLTWIYVEFGQHLVVAWVLYGIKPVVIAVVAKAITGLSGAAFRRPHQVIIAVAALGLYLGGTNEILLMFGSGLFGVLFTWIRRRIGAGLTVVAPLVSLTQALPSIALTIPATFSLASLFLVFLKIGAVLYGSGYVLVTFLERDLVDRLGWLTQSQLLDVIAIGQVTPGPVFTTATAIGYVMGGLPGAAVATIGIFLPSFLFVAMVNPLITYLRSNAVASAFLDGVNAGAVALMAGVAFTLGRAAIVDVPSAVVGMGAVYLMVRRGVSPTWLIPIGAIIGVSYQWGAGAVTGGL